MAFKRRTGADWVPEDPEQLYRQLALVNDGPEALWAHQADVLRSWHGSHPNIGNHRNQNLRNCGSGPARVVCHRCRSDTARSLLLVGIVGSS